MRVSGLQYHFATVDESALGRLLADVNYLLPEFVTEPPPAHSPPQPEQLALGVYAPFAEAVARIASAAPRSAAAAAATVVALEASAAPPTSTTSDGAIVAPPSAAILAAIPPDGESLAAPTTSEPTLRDGASETGLDEREAGYTWLRAQQRASQLDATVRFERLLRRGHVDASSPPSGHWVVLVGGEVRSQRTEQAPKGAAA
jgi:hypothetical protein